MPAEHGDQIGENTQRQQAGRTAPGRAPAHGVPDDAGEQDDKCRQARDAGFRRQLHPAAGGEVVAVNEELVGNPSLANDDPYDAGWLVMLKPDDWDSVVGSLVTGADVAAPYEAKMDSEGFGGCA